MTDLTDFDRWLIANGYLPEDATDETFHELWAAFEASKEVPIGTSAPASIIVVGDERWTGRAVRVPA